MTEYANTFEDFNINIPSTSQENKDGEVYTICPVCSSSRKREHQNEKKLAVNIKKGTWFCQHCAWTGGLTPLEFLKGKKVVDQSSLQMPIGKVYSFFEKRGISRRTVDWCGTRFSVQSIKQKDTGEFLFKDCVCFVYRMRGLIRLIKYRDGKKNFKIAAESTMMAWGIDNLKGQKEGLITEGEMDAYSYIEAGFTASTSVPNGSTISPKEKEEYLRTGKMPEDIHLNLTWLDNCYEYYEHLELIYICTDEDPAGIKLRMELGRRFGYDRCRIVKYSTYTYLKDGIIVPCKDANEVLMHHGKEAVKDTLTNAQSFPITDVITVNDISDEIDNIYYNGIQKGKTTGYPILDPYFNWSNGHFIVMNGFPNMGKTTLMFNLLILHAKLYNSRWGIYCPENYPVKHAYATCIEIYGGNTLDITVKDRMDYAVYSDAKKFINEHIEFVNKPSGYRGEELRDLSLRMIKQRGINGFVTDPWNSLIPSKTKYGNEDKELEQELSAEQRFAINTNTNRIILAHPNTPLRDKDKVYPAPSPFEIKGGGIWFAKAYEILCSHLQSIGDNQYLTEIHVQKVKFQKETGLRTERNEPVLLKFERRSNRYIQQDGYNPFTSNETVEQVAELDLCF